MVDFEQVNINWDPSHFQEKYYFLTFRKSIIAC